MFSVIISYTYIVASYPVHVFGGGRGNIHNKKLCCLNSAEPGLSIQLFVCMSVVSRPKHNQAFTYSICYVWFWAPPTFPRGTCGGDPTPRLHAFEFIPSRFVYIIIYTLIYIYMYPRIYISACVGHFGSSTTLLFPSLPSTISVAG